MPLTEAQRSARNEICDSPEYSLTSEEREAIVEADPAGAFFIS